MIVMMNELGCEGKGKVKVVAMQGKPAFWLYGQSCESWHGTSNEQPNQALIATGAQISINFKLLLYQAKVLTVQ